MAQFKAQIQSYADASSFLGGKISRRIAHNTTVRNIDGTIALIYHSTAVVEFHADGRILLNSGGWLTVTTKQRINEVLPSPYRVYQKSHEWFLYDRARDISIPFSDGMTIHLQPEQVTGR